MTKLFRLAMALTAVSLIGAGCSSGGDDDVEAGAGGPLSGLLRLTAGECTDAGVTAGSYFRMVQPDGTVADGPFVDNGDSGCGDITWTALTPGAAGGLALGEYQPHPDPAFDDGGNATAGDIITPVAWFGVSFSVATNETDPQTGGSGALPSVTVDGGRVTGGDLSAFAAAWNGQHFNQGSPKPGGATPGNTAGPTGTYDEATGTLTLEWSSQIEGGPFDRFTGVWHLEGTLEAA